MKRLILRCIPQQLRKQARQYFKDGDATGFLSLASNDCHMLIVLQNSELLLERGIYEEALLWAYTSCRVNHSEWSLKFIQAMFNKANRQKLLEAGDPLPEGDCFTVYRGVAGKGDERRERSISWTLDLPIACWFANRFSLVGLGDPAVYTASLTRDEVLAYYNDRNEHEIIALPATCTRVDLSEAEIQQRAAESKNMTVAELMGD